jgi:hypothetical protein
VCSMIRNRGGAAIETAPTAPSGKEKGIRPPTLIA